MEPGSIIDGKYQIIRKLGAGGFASVYQADSLATKQTVAVKVLDRHGTPEREVAVARFQREAQVLAALRSEHSVSLLDYGQSDGANYIVFEYLAGENLQEVLKSRGTLPAAAVEAILRQVLLSLAEAHAHGVIHRDIKPANIMLTPQPGRPWLVKVIDFGIALPDPSKDGAALTRTGYAVGTPLFMAPEQLYGAPATVGTDLYAIGLVACDLLLGNKQLDRTELAEGVLPALPADERLVEVLRRLLHPNASQRFARAEDVLAALDGVQLRPRSIDLEVRRRRRLRDVVPQILLVAFAVIAISALTAWLLSILDTPTPAAQPIKLTTPVLRGASVEETATVAVEEAPCVRRPGRGHFATARGLDATEWSLYVPEGADRALPVMLFFHGAGYMPTDYFDGGLVELADALDVAIVAPVGTSTFAWPADMAVGWVDDVVADAAKQTCLDAERWVLFGDDTGGFATMPLACDARVIAYVTSSYSPLVGQSIPCAERAIPRLVITPTRSRHIPLRGGVDCAVGPPHLSLREHQAWWIARNACTGEAEPVEIAEITCERWACEAPLVSCAVKGGQQWRTMGDRMFDVFNCDGGTYSRDHLTVVRDFLSEHLD